MKTKSKKLFEIELKPVVGDLPANVAALIADARQRIDTLEDTSRAAMPAFVPCDFELVFRALAAVQQSNLVTGQRFLEWGSGIGVIACLATQLGFDAIGIEIERPLVDIAEDLAAAHDLETEFACGSFIPADTEVHLEMPDDFAWLTTEAPTAYEDLDLAPDDFDLIFAYPWPGEENVIFDLFTNHAATGSLLLTYHGLEGIRLQRKRRA